MDFDELKNKIYNEFSYDLNGCDTEIKVMAFICQSAVQEKLSALQETVETQTKRFDEIVQSLLEGLKSGTNILSTHLDSKQSQITADFESQYNATLKKLEQEVTLVARTAVANEFSHHGVKLNKQLIAVINEFKSVTEDTKYKSQSISKSLTKVISRTGLFAMLGAIWGSATTFITMLLLQNQGIINLPLNISLDAKAVADNILSVIGH